MEELIASFDSLVNEFKLKGHDLLDFYNTSFERDFVEFTMHNSGLENAIQDFMEKSLTQMTSIDKQLELINEAFVRSTNSSVSESESLSFVQSRHHTVAGFFLHKEQIKEPDDLNEGEGRAR